MDLPGVSAGPRVQRAADAAAIARAAAEEVARRAAAAAALRGGAALALAGGSTPKALYRLLADAAAPFRARVPWPAVHVFFGDERAVPPESSDANARMAREALLSHVPVGAVHRIEGERGAAEAAVRYEDELFQHFGDVPLPVFDVVLLGLGADGHTASLFPGSPALEERRRWVVPAPAGLAPWVDRVTLTLPVLEAARFVLFLVAGADKANALRRLVRPRAGEEPIPAAMLRPRGEVLVLADEAAAGDLEAE
ncbi:MAG TPA: 6-phosphogluconolactonase [Anaeromyxobacter sp.]|nr:6-phosphogluconolactonase [Anaeromyxobacter sp.]